MNSDRSLGRSLLVDETDKFGRLFQGGWPTIGNGKINKCKAGRFKHGCVRWNVQQTNDRTDSSRIQCGQLVLIGVQRTTRIQPTLRIYERHRHSGQYPWNDPPQQRGFVRVAHTRPPAGLSASICSSATANSGYAVSSSRGYRTIRTSSRLCSPSLRNSTIVLSASGAAKLTGYANAPVENEGNETLRKLFCTATRRLRR
jgi:hypothetical protein